MLAYLPLFLAKLRIQSGGNWAIHIRISTRNSKTIFDISYYNKDSCCQACVSCMQAKNICVHYSEKSLSETFVHAPTGCPIKYLFPNILRELWPSIPIVEDLHRILSCWFLQRLPRRNTYFRTFAFWAIDSYGYFQGGTPASGPSLWSTVTYVPRLLLLLFRRSFIYRFLSMMTPSS